MDRRLLEPATGRLGPRSRYLQSSVRPAFRDKILGTAKTHGHAVDWTTGEIVPGIELRQGDPYISFRSEPGYVDAIDGQWGDLVDPALLDGQ